MFCPECGYKNKEDATFCFACGSILRNILGGGRYEIIRFLNKGGMEQLFLAKDTKMKTNIVVKQLIPPRNEEELNQQYLEDRMKEEARLLYRLNYRGLPRVMDFFPEQGSFFLIMQHIDGEDLDQILSRQPEGRVEVQQCVIWLDRLLDIVGFLHGQEPPIIHRDVKPRNIMIDCNGELYLIDFGIACIMEKGRKDYTRVGTYEYASPEHFAGSIDTRSDIYSLGATIYHLLTGLSPADRAHPGSFPPLKNYLPDAPDKLAEILAKMTAFSKEERYADCEEIRKALRGDLQLTDFLKKGGTTIGLHPVSCPPPMESSETGNGIVQEKNRDTGSNQAKTKEMESRRTEEIPPEKQAGKGRSDEKTGRAASRRYPLAVTIFLILFLGFCAAVFIYRDKIPYISKPAGYKIIVSSSSKDKIMEIKELLREKNLTSNLVIKKTYKTQGVSHQVLTQFDSRTLAVYAYKQLKERGYNLFLVENINEGVAIRLIEQFDSMEATRKRTAELNKIFNTNSFVAEEKPRQIPDFSFELEIKKIPSLIEAEKIKVQLAPYSKDLKIIPIKGKDNSPLSTKSP